MAQVPSHNFTTSYKGLSRVLVNEVLVAQAYIPKPSNDKFHGKKFKAIWDTGATGTVITKKVVNECQLKPVGITQVHGVGGKTNRQSYFVNIALPNRVGVSYVRVIEGDLIGGADVLIGMDIISQGDFAVTNLDGKTIFSFRIPSIERIDFVKQAQSTIPLKKDSPKIGRNAPCPCGSGKKYKKCCGA